MKSFEQVCRFNRFPIHKEKFFGLIQGLCDTNTNFSSLIYIYPRIYNKVYVTITDKELASLSKRLDEPDLVEALNTVDALLSSKKVDDGHIILHLPAMIRNMATIKTLPNDPNRRALFTIHFFACLFYELSFAREISILTMKRVSNVFLANQGQPMEDTKFDEKKLQDRAAHGEETYVGILKDFLTENESSWLALSEELFDWDKLQSQLIIKK